MTLDFIRQFMNPQKEPEPPKQVIEETKMVVVPTTPIKCHSDSISESYKHMYEASTANVVSSDTQTKNTVIDKTAKQDKVKIGGKTPVDLNPQLKPVTTKDTDPIKGSNKKIATEEKKIVDEGLAGAFGALAGAAVSVAGSNLARGFGIHPAIVGHVVGAALGRRKQSKVAAQKIKSPSPKPIPKQSAGPTQSATASNQTPSQGSSPSRMSIFSSPNALGGTHAHSLQYQGGKWTGPGMPQQASSAAPKQGILSKIKSGIQKGRITAIRKQKAERAGLGLRKFGPQSVDTSSSKETKPNTTSPGKIQHALHSGGGSTNFFHGVPTQTSKSPKSISLSQNYNVKMPYKQQAASPPKQSSVSIGGGSTSAKFGYGAGSSKSTSTTQMSSKVNPGTFAKSLYKAAKDINAGKNIGSGAAAPAAKSSSGKGSNVGSGAVAPAAQSKYPIGKATQFKKKKMSESVLNKILSTRKNLLDRS